MANTKIGVTGATGQLGRKVIENLKKVIPAEQIVALVRNPEKAKDLGVAVKEFDYTHPELISKGLEGISKLLLISGSDVGQRFAQHKNVIDAAKEAGVQLVAYTSLLHADKSTLGLAPEHKATEEYLKASGLNYTILRNGWYTENYTSSIGTVLASGAVYGAAGDGKISAATRNDYAKAAVKVVTTEGHDHKIYELGGTPFTLSEYAAAIAAQSGKEINYVNLPEAEFAKALEGAGLSAPLSQFFSVIDTEIEKGALETDAKDLPQLIGSLESLEDAVKNALNAVSVN